MPPRASKNTDGAVPCLIELPSPTVTCEAEHFEFRWDTPAPEGWLRISFDGIQESSDGIHSEISFDWVYGTLHGHLHGPSRLNMLASRSRKELANDLIALKGSANWTPPEDYMVNNPDLQKPHRVTIRWGELVETACARVVAMSREGNPFFVIGDDLRDDDRVEYLIRPLLPLYQTAAIICDGGGGKSWVAQYSGLAVCLGQGSGQSRLPLDIRRRVNTLYLDWESDRKEIERRGSWICRGLGLTAMPSETFHYRRQERPLADDLGKLRQYIVQNNIGLVVIDSLGPASGGDILKTESPIRTMNAIRSLGEQVTKLVVAHISKGEAKEDGRSTIFGSAYFGNLARSIWELKRTDRRLGGSVIEAALIHQKVNIGKKEPSIGINYRWDDEQRTFVVEATNILDNPELARYEGTDSAIISHLRTGAKTQKQLSQLTGASQSKVSRWLDKLGGEVGTVRIPGVTAKFYYLVDRGFDEQEALAGISTAEASSRDD